MTIREASALLDEMIGQGLLSDKEEGAVALAVQILDACVREDTDKVLFVNTFEELQKRIDVSRFCDKDGNDPTSFEELVNGFTGIAVETVATQDDWGQTRYLTTPVTISEPFLGMRQFRSIYQGDDNCLGEALLLGIQNPRRPHFIINNQVYEVRTWEYYN